MDGRKTVIKVNLLFKYAITYFYKSGYIFKLHAQNKTELEVLKEGFYECKDKYLYISHAVVTYWITGIVADVWL